MARIPEFQRSNLKSSQHGTPGADFSTGRAFDAVAQSTNQIASASFDLAVKRKAAKDSAITNESVLSMDIGMESSWREHQEAMKYFEGDPKERAEIFRVNAQKQVEERAKMAPNDEVRRAITENGLRMVQSRTLREIDAADKNQGVIAFTKVNDAQKLAEEDAARVGADESLSFGEKMSRMKELLAQSEGTVRAAASVLDPLQAQRLSQESPAAIMKAGATGMLANSPEELLAVLDTKDKDGKNIFDGRLSPQEIQTLRKEAERSTLNFKERRIREDLHANLTQVTDTFDLATSGDIVGALAMTESMEDGELKSNMRESLLREGITEADRTEKVYDLMTKFSTLSADLDSHVKTVNGVKKGTMKATLQDLVDFQALAIEAHATGDLKDSTRTTYLTKFLPQLQRKAKKDALMIKGDPLDEETSAIARAWRGITRVIPDKGEAVNAHQDFQVRLAESGDFSPEGVNKALIATLDEHRRVRFPKSMFISGSVNAVLDHEKSLVATGVQGQTGAPTSGKVPPAATTRIGTDNEGQKWKVTFDNDGNELKREKLNG